MNSISAFYKRNIYGVIGTLIFHILLVSLFLIFNVNRKGYVKEEQIIIEFAEPIQEMVKEPAKAKIPEANLPGSKSLATNRASNISAPKEDRFFDADYKKEVENARKLASDVNKQLQKEVPNMNDIKMPVDKTEGKKPESIKNIVYSGKSNIKYDLKGRYHLSLPIPVYLAQGGGTVVVDILVDKRGQVIKATARKNNTIADLQVFYYAEFAASNTVFNSDPSAPAQQKGTIQYNFIAQ
jgi:hypothetical protein